MIDRDRAEGVRSSEGEPHHLESTRARCCQKSTDAAAGVGHAGRTRCERITIAEPLTAHVHASLRAGHVRGQLDDDTAGRDLATGCKRREVSAIDTRPAITIEANAAAPRAPNLWYRCACAPLRIAVWLCRRRGARRQPSRIVTATILKNLGDSRRRQWCTIEYKFDVAAGISTAGRWLHLSPPSRDYSRPAL